MAFFAEMEKMIFKFIGKCKETLSQDNEKRTKLKDSHFATAKIYYRAAIIKTSGTGMRTDNRIKLRVYITKSRHLWANYFQQEHQNYSMGK